MNEEKMYSEEYVMDLVNNFRMLGIVKRDLEKENQDLKKQNARLTREVCNRLIANYDYSSTLKDELNKERIDKIVLKEANKLTNEENKQLKERLAMYEDPEDMTLMFMWCEEKAKDKIKELKEKEELHLNRIDELTDRVVDLESVIEEVSQRLEYYLIGNMKYEDSQKEFRKLLQILNKTKEL